MSKKYTDKFKRNAVALSERVGVKKASQKLSVSKNAIYTWRKNERPPGKTRIKGLLPGESAEQGLKRLEKQIAEYRQANEALMKALGRKAPQNTT